MSILLSDVITAARDRHAAFHRSKVTHAVLARWCSEYVNHLIVRCATRDTRYMQQSASIVLALSDANTASGAGAGSGGGLPGEIEADGDVQLTTSTTGSLVQIGTSAEDGATIIVAERVVTSATASTVTSTGAGRTVNEDMGRLVYVTLGTGHGQFRQIASNTSDTWTLENDWTTPPDSTSLVVILEPSYFVDGDLGTATAVPSVDTQTGYLVKTDAAGLPYIDYTTPLVASVDHGVTLPAMHALTGGTVRYAETAADHPLRIVGYEDRFRVAAPAVYRAGETVFLCGQETDWQDVESLELHYIPVAPQLTALTDVLLVPDAAKGCIVAQAAAFMALRLAGEAPVDAAAFAMLGDRAEAAYVASVGLNSRAKAMRIREAW